MVSKLVSLELSSGFDPHWVSLAPHFKLRLESHKLKENSARLCHSKVEFKVGYYTYGLGKKAPNTSFGNAMSATLTVTTEVVTP